MVDAEFTREEYLSIEPESSPEPYTEADQSWWDDKRRAELGRQCALYS